MKNATNLKPVQTSNYQKAGIIPNISRNNPPPEKPGTAPTAPNAKFKANLQKYYELHAKSKQMIEELHSRRIGSASLMNNLTRNLSEKSSFQFL